MKKEKIVSLAKELVCDIIIVAVLLLIAKKLGWTDASVLDNVIGVAIGWVLWRGIMLAVSKRAGKKKD